MSSTCPLPVDWLDYLEGDKPDDMSAHLRNCPSCRQVVASLSKQPGRIPEPDWAKRFAHASSGLMVEEKVSEPSVAELWLSASRWSFEDVEYAAPERSLVLVVAHHGAYDDEELHWYDVAPVRTDVEQALPTDLLVRSEESSYEVPLRVVFSLQCKVERRQLHTRVGRLHDIHVVFAALNDETDAWRWGNPLEGPDDPRLWWGPSFAETVKALRTPWLQYLDGARRQLREQESAGGEGSQMAQVFEFVPRAWTRDAPGFERALAAAASDEDAESMWELVSDELHLQLAGVFDNDWDTGDLLFFVRRAQAKHPVRLRLLVYVASADEPVSSDVFEPKAGERVRFADTHVPSEVERLGAEVVT